MTTLQQADSRKTPGPAGKQSRQQEVSGSPMEQLTTYLKGVRAEWTKISWPTTQQIIGQTIVVLAVVSVMTLLLLVMDFSFHSIVNAITPHRS
ncbi:preprotein translocase subunit SecE [Vampirovibrio chlorellavorus]|uniref:preprotein translocase subunit SecE n=1 Tax=Vampirovibrio chlorellavorus TaxID=758823 RepID=UPI0026E94F0B|nr:preprotein translocase subunit SecE [Vampirovibrio chlorellavorus]